MILYLSLHNRLDELRVPLLLLKRECLDLEKNTHVIMRSFRSSKSSKLYRVRNRKAIPPTRGGKLKNAFFLCLLFFSTFNPDMKIFYPKKTSKSTYQMPFFQLFFPKFRYNITMRISKKSYQKHIIFPQITPIWRFVPSKKAQNWRKN